MRSDTQRNRALLVRAASELFEASADPVNMSTIARKAQVSPATAYRHFASVEDVLAAYRHDVSCRLRDYSRERQDHESGLALLDAVCRHWVSLVLVHGHAMVQMRSRRGYLDRLRAGTDYLTVQAEALHRPLQETTAELDLVDLGDEAVFLWNALFDPRDILDLVGTVGLTEQQTATRLISTLCAALVGWAESKDG